MKRAILVIGADKIKYTKINKQLSDLHYLKKNIFRCSTVEAALSREPESIHVILADSASLPPTIADGLQLLQTVYKDIPIIVFFDKEDDSCISAINAGAQDYLVMGDYDNKLLEKTISVAIERKSQSIRKENILREYIRQFDNGPMPMWIAESGSMKFLAVNNAAIEKYGYSKEEFAQMTIHDIRPTEDVEKMLKHYLNRDSDFYDPVNWRHKKKNGEMFYARVYSNLTVFNGVKARLTFAIDVNEQVLAEKRNAKLTNLLKEQKEQLDGILFSMNDAIWSRRADNLELTYANNAYYKLYGYSAEEMDTDKMLIINSIYPDDLQRFSDAITEVRTKGATAIVYRFIHRDGSIKTLRSTSIYKKGLRGKPDLINGITTDITKETELTETIRNTEQNLLATINNTRDMIWSINAKLEIVFCNKSYQDSVYELAGVIPKPGDYVLGEWGSESYFNTRKKDYERALGGESFTVFVEEHYDGGLLHTEISSNPIFDDDGKIVGVICIARDISEQKNQFVQIQRQNEKLREIAWIQSHKVRGPVASILGLASLFSYEPNGHDKNIERLEKLQIATTDLDTIIREVVDKTNTIQQEPASPKD